MIIKIIEKLAKSIGYNSIYKTYYELSHSADINFVQDFKDTQNNYLKFAMYINPNIDLDTKRTLLNNDFDSLAIQSKLIDYKYKAEYQQIKDIFDGLVKFQGFYLDYLPQYLFEGEFSRLHSKFAALDPHIEYDTNKTRFRTYNLFQISTEIIKRFDNTGDLIFAGINYGVAPLILSHIHKDKKLKFYFIDPFDGTKNQIVNLDPDVFGRHLPQIDYEIVVGCIPEYLPKVNNLVFVHLNTNNFEAELDSLTSIIQQLAIGGAIVWDIFGWLDKESQKKANSFLESQNIFKIILPTRQLLIIKN